MDATAAVSLLVDGFDRVHQSVNRVLDGIDDDALTFLPDDDANSIAWLIWHLTRVQDDHVAGAAGSDQLWLAAGWRERLGLPLDAHDTGYGHSASQVAAVRTTADLLRDYHSAVHDRSVDFVRTLSVDDLDRIVDERWDPPVTMAVRLVSVLSDDLQHVGQAAYVRGLAERARI